MHSFVILNLASAVLAFNEVPIFTNSKAQKFLNETNGTCDAYGKGPPGEGDCGKENCGECWNPNGRPGKMCPGTGNQGYFCVDENNFACLDWTFGSKSMKTAEEAFNSKYSDNVKFGVGTYGGGTMRGLGSCFRIKYEFSDQELIVQSINTGSDVSGNQFDLMQGDGGTGAFNWCAGNSWSIYPGDNSAWGAQYGGWPTRDGCKKLPPFPQHMDQKYEYDNLIELCEYSFDQKLRGANGENPTIKDLARVECPQELVEFTQIKRTDDPKGYNWTDGARPNGFPNNSVKCGESGGSFCMTRMMDCRKPSGAFKDNIDANLVEDSMKLVQICSNDGYTRMDNRCGCEGCYC